RRGSDLMLRIEQLIDPQALEMLTPEWEVLDAELSPRTPFTSPLWNILWWKHMRSNNLFICDEFFSHTVRDSDSRLLAVAPMMLTHRPGVGPLRLRELHFFGADPNMTEIRGLACRPEDQSKVICTLSEHFLANSENWHWLRWTGIPQNAVACGAIDSFVQLRHIVEKPDYYLLLPAAWDEFKSSLSRNIKESLRKCYNSLKREGHTFTFRIVDRPEDTTDALVRFFNLHTARARLSTTEKHPDVFDAPRAKDFLTSYARAMAERDCLRIFEIEIGGTVVATRIGFVFGEELYLYFSGYDPNWGKYSIMTTVVAESIKWAIENRLRVVNLSTGNHVSKTRWGPKEITFRQGVQVSPKWWGQLAFATYSKAHSMSPDTHLGLLLNNLRRNRAC
ncbi:MAG: GNAT family N-acetyltransferase, partial [Candidatus Binatia bacterium]